MGKINVGVLNSLNLEKLSKAEQNIVQNLSKVWSIGFCRTQLFKNTEYSIIFAKPTDYLSETFHLTREILVVFSGYDNFQSRTFDFIDKTLNDYNSRLDKLCVIIVSRDKNIDKKIKDIIIQDNESRIIIPFSYDELLQNTNKTTIQINKLKESFYSRDLFAYDTPLRHDTYFFGRHKTIQELYGKYQTGQWGSLFGLRRIGKTSVLFSLMRILKTREEPVVYIDCSETSFYFKRWYEALYKIIKMIASENNVRSKYISAEEKYTEQDASEVFERDLEKIHRQLNHKRILIILDEVENITFKLSPKDHWRKDNDFMYLWQNLRSLFQKKQELVSFIIAGVNPFAIETPTINTFDNPIYRYITPLYLPFFTNKEVKEMVTTIGSYMGVTFDDEIYTYFIDDFGGHPFIVRQVCSKIIKDSKTNTRPLHITKFQYLEDRDTFKRNIFDYLEQIIKILKEKYSTEYELLEYLASDDIETFKDFAQSYPKIIEHLIGYGLIKENNNNYYFNMESVKEHIKEKEKLSKKPTKIEEKWAQISAKRNEFESNLRIIIKDVLKHKHGVIEAKNKFIEIISDQKIKKKFEGMSYADIFNSHLYLEDLRKVIEKNYMDFVHIFPTGDKGKFKQYMEYVNSHRIDAHANDIEDDEFALVEIGLNWLNNKIEIYLH